MIQFKFGLVFIAGLLFLISCNFQSKNDSGTFQRWNSKKYSFSYPAEWKIDSTGRFGAPVIIYSSKESASDKFPESIVLTINPIPDSLSDNKFELDKSQLSAMGNILVFKKEILSDSIIFYRVEYENITEGTFSMQGIWIGKHEAYQLICASEKDKFVKYREIYDKVLSSFAMSN